MANEIRAQFETYIKNMTETISKEIFLEDLKQLCNVYEGQLEECVKLYKEHTSTNQQLIESNLENIDKIQNVQEEFAEKLNILQKEIEEFQEKNGQILDSYTSKVEALNDEMQEEFIRNLFDSLKNYKRELSRELNQYHDNIKLSLESGLTEVSLQNFVNQMKESTKKIEEGLQVLQGGFQDIFENYSKKVGEYGDRENERLRSLIEGTVQEAMEKFDRATVEAVNKQKIMLEEKMTEISSMKEQIVSLNESMKRMQQSNNEKLSILIKIMEKEEKITLRMELQRRSEKKYLFFLVVCNIMMFIISIVTMVSMKPWKIYGVVPVAGTIGGMILILLYLVFMKKRKAFPKKNS